MAADVAVAGTEFEALTATLRQAGCVFAEDEACMIIEASGGSRETLQTLVSRRCAGEPLEVVVGFADFAGLRVAVAPGVFVPRQRTVGLVALAVNHLASMSLADRVAVDLGCGTGALAAALLAELDCEMYAIDNSAAAVACARQNLPSATVLQGDLFSPLPVKLQGRVRVVLANLPYVPTAAIDLLPREARLYEPLETLDGGTDGLRPLARALGQLSMWLHPDGVYLAEVHASQLDAAAQLAAEHAYDLRADVDPDDGTALVRITPVHRSSHLADVTGHPIGQPNPQGEEALLTPGTGDDATTT